MAAAESSQTKSMEEILQEAKKRHAEGPSKATGKKGKSSGQQCGEGNQKQWPAHPYGLNKKSWMFKSMLQMIQDDGLWVEDLDAKQHVDTILALYNEKIERSIGVFNPKVNTPRQQGNWKFDLVLTEFPVPEMVKAILAFLDCKCNSDKLSVEMRRPMPQPETEQKM